MLPLFLCCYLSLGGRNNAIEYEDRKRKFRKKRFDVKKDGKKLLHKDFAQIADRSEDTNGINYKYDFSYEEIANLMMKSVASYKIEIEKIFRLVFNYQLQFYPHLHK